MDYADAMVHLPLVAILRGLRPEEAIDVVGALVEEGFRLIEVPLNSPSPFETIEALVQRFGTRALIGAGTVLDAAAVDRLATIGARLVVSPDTNPEVITRTKLRGMISLPGVATPSEAFAALRAGADGLKAFPAEGIPPTIIKAWRAVIPPGVPILAVGGITPTNMAPYVDAGAAGFGLGSALYKPGRSPQDVRAAARAFVTAWAGIAPTR